MSLLEIAAFVTSLIGVILGVLGPRTTWPWWNISSLLYAILFFQSAYYASAALQFIFIAGGFWGWFGWGSFITCAISSSYRNWCNLLRYRIFWLCGKCDGANIDGVAKI